MAKSNSEEILLLNAYGPTETTITSTIYQASPVGRSEYATGVPIGRPLADTHIYLLDSALRPVPIGIAGELYIGGARLARGYYHRPESTADCFIPTPSAPRPATVFIERVIWARLKWRHPVPWSHRSPGENPWFPGRVRRSRIGIEKSHGCS